ncbi:MAG: aerobic carbon-monoxide dehydrogenase large subunit [Actinomycetota bacterium]|nr:carbon-monoxide dehydrogenase large subunit [Rubrobacteraceae bacterium]MDQ3496715.1 aerobic carbon-monoxide dehydrogenase large subunit [Actinomycetota bacterium]
MATLQGHTLGDRMPRKEDGRFIRGKGHYVDDVRLPQMLQSAILRSPYAHARINSVDTSAALELSGVRAVITGNDLAEQGLAWMPTLAGDTQAVLATDKVRFQGQEVAFVVADDAYIAQDALELIEVDYEPLDPVMDSRKALDEDAPVIRDDKEDKEDNFIFSWDAGDKEATGKAFDEAEVTVRQEMFYPRIHPAPMETCGAVADYDVSTGQMTIHMTSQAPHAHRTLFAIVSGLPEHQIRIISPDIGGGFGNKVPIYPGYVCAAVASLVLGRPVKWMESRSENLMSTSFARDYHMVGEIAATSEGKILGARSTILANHGAFDAHAQPGEQYPTGFFPIFTSCYDVPTAYAEATGVYTNRAPGGIAYRCSFRVTEAIYVMERTMDVLADELEMDPVELRRKNFVTKEQMPYVSVMGWEYDGGDYEGALQEALRIAGYEELLEEQRRAREEGRIMGVGISTFTEIVGAGPGKKCHIAGIEMFDAAELRIHPTGKAILKLGVKSQGQGHETTFAQIVAGELGIPAENVDVREGDTDNTPFGLGTYGSRSTPVGGAATAVVTRKVREKAKKIAAHLLEAAEGDIEYEDGRFFVKGSPESAKTMDEVAFAAYTDVPEGEEAGLEAVTYYDPPEMTYPFGAYICVVEIDRGTGQVEVKRFIAVDDCGVRINPTVIDGQVHGGLAQGIGTALMEVIDFDEEGNHMNSSFMDYLIPTSMEVPNYELGEFVTPSTHHPLGARGVAESPTVGSPPAVVNAVVDALSPHGVRNVDMPLTPAKVWKLMREHGVEA